MKLKDIIAASFISSAWTLLALAGVLYGASRADGCEKPIDVACILLGNIHLDLPGVPELPISPEVPELPGGFELGLDPSHEKSLVSPLQAGLRGRQTDSSQLPAPCLLQLVL